MQGLLTPYADLPYYPGVSFTSQPLTGSISYPPLSAFMFAAIYRVYLLIGSPSRFVYYFLLKQPIVISDILTAIVLARIITMSKGPSTARLGFLIWIYLPLSIFASSIWGALDPIALLLIMLSLHYLLKSQENYSACFLGLAIFLKTIPVVALPVLVMSVRTGLDRRLRYGVISLAIPALGTIIPVLLLNWNLNGVFNNLAFQVDIPAVGGSLGEMSLLGRLIYTLVPNGSLNTTIGLLWIPVLLSSYTYIARRRLPLLQGVLVPILAFSISRPFLSEQWALYPLATLLAMVSQKNAGHFVGLSIPATIYLVFNNNLLVRFLGPLSMGYAAINVYGHSSLTQYALADTLLILAGLFFVEALMTMFERESILCSILSNALHSMKIHVRERILMTTGNERKVAT